ncbi:sugar transferase [Hoeflea poritis]|uniref:Sugar transferase n=1 Tax=Hoeflea poritis TaxID=2993659 RepID=A0ABT4VWG4_9HYPH|nr:sugar transferase [Hoeflea poritis]MDA4848348.1 sugar transferase [Hoeflea poritis]
MKNRLLFFVDFLLVFVSAIGAYAIRENFQPSEMWIVAFIPYWVISTVGIMVGFLVFRTHRSVWRFASVPELSSIVKAVTLGIAVAVLAVFILTRLDHVARSVPLIHWGLAISLLVAARLASRRFSGSGARSSRDASVEQPVYVLVVGLNQVSELYLRCVSDLSGGQIAVAGLLSENPADRYRTMRSCEVLGSPADLVAIITRCALHGQPIGKIVVTEPIANLSGETRQALADCGRGGSVEIDYFERRLGFRPRFTLVAGMDISNDNVAERPAALPVPGQGAIAGGWSVRAYRFFKRAFDISGALLALTVFSPLVLAVCLLVMIDLGRPLTFWQVRPGMNGRPFRLTKFRTMGPAHDGFGDRIADADRTSRLGTFLRKSRLDELPQLVNILKGDMSFVGPRPLLPVDQPRDMAARLSVRPGLTGWAQINGGRDLSIERKNELDLWYVANASMALDFRILRLTAYFLIAGNVTNEKPSNGKTDAAGEMAQHRAKPPTGRAIRARVEVAGE